MRVFFRSLRCFFLAIRLRRFLMTEPTRPPPFLAQRQTGTPSRSRRREAGHTPGVRQTARTRTDCASAYRPRSLLAYPLRSPPDEPRLTNHTPTFPQRVPVFSPQGRQGEPSPGADEGRPQVLVNRLLGNSEGTADPDSLKLPGVNQSVDRHLGDPHDGGYFGDGKKSHVA